MNESYKNMYVFFYMIAGKYEIGKEIKKGAFGSIYIGLCTKNREPVAIKRDYGDMATLKHEVKIMNYLATSKIKQIPDIYYYGLYDGRPCLVFTLYECSLYDYMKHKYVTIEKMNILMIKILDIFEKIHNVYVVHRDIKPQNFMIKNGDIFLIDFGLATFYINEKGEHYENDISETIVGSPIYVSINIHKGQHYDCRDDLISLGYVYLYMIGDPFWVIDDCESDLPLYSRHHPYNVLLMENKSYMNMKQYISSKSIYRYMEYVYHLEYSQKPKYIPLKNVFL